MNGGGGSDEGTASSEPPQPLDWKFSQVFGERTAGEEVQEVDIISAIEFDKTGDHLATGDRGGRVVLFERTDTRDNGHRRDLERMDYPISRHPEFRYKTEFQSHEPEVQEKKVKKICDMNVDSSETAGNGSVSGSSVPSSSKSLANGGYPERLYSNDISFPPGGIPSLRLPVVVASHETSLVARCRRIYAHAHDYHINSISNNRSCRRTSHFQ